MSSILGPPNRRQQARNLTASAAPALTVRYSRRDWPGALIAASSQDVA